MPVCPIPLDTIVLIVYTPLTDIVMTKASNHHNPANSFISTIGMAGANSGNCMKSKIVTIEAANKDWMRDDVKIQWCGQYVRLTLENKLLTMITADYRTVEKVTAWVLKNNYRCTQIQSGKIIL